MSLRILLDVLSPRARAVNQRRAPRRLRLEPLDDRSLPSGYVQANLASDVPGQAVILDPQLVNAWGMTANSAPTGAWWISCEGTGLSTLYTGDVTQANGTVTPFVKGTLTVTLPGGSPTGQVFNAPAPIPAAEDFFVSAANSNGVVSTAPSRFITVSNTGHITGWAASVPPPPPAPPSRNAQLVGTTEGAVYTGLAIATVGTSDFLYAADFRNGRIDVFDNKFAPTTSLAGDFVDPNIPAGYLPYNIQNLENKLYVTYARQVDGDPEPDKGRGFISVFDTSGNFLNRLVSRGKLREPWGMAIAPSNFGELSNALLVANHRDGRINAYDPETGKFIDRLRDADDRPIKIDGLHGLHFGNGKSAGDLNALYFTAGPDDGAHGLMGSLRVAPEAAAAAE
ncbi:MAG TPA: TIGR03118 family protein, partial [Gemmataceae bacterium]|nr:TIGR03118 family protein [Gemmataceae bacterium]